MKIGRYEVRETLSNGVMADVYLAYDEQLQREVVVKLMPESAKVSILAEAQRMVGLGDVPVVQIYDVGFEDERLFYVMPLMQGGTLMERVREGGISAWEIRPILEALTTALTAAHENDIVHCDIKPANILFTAQDEAHIADFGISHHLNDTNAGITTTSGTPAYMSPEQWRGEPPTPQIDIYQCGVLLFLLLTGRLPYQANDREGYKTAHCQTPIPKATNYVSHLPTEYDAFFDRALAKERDDRFNSMKQLEAEFLKTLNDAPTVILPNVGSLPRQEQPEPLPFHPSQLVRGHEWVTAWAGATIIGWLIGAWIINLLSVRMGLSIIPRLADRLFAVGMASIMGGVVSGLIATVTLKTIEGRILTQLPRHLIWKSGLVLALFLELGLIIGAVIATSGSYWSLTFLLVGCLPAGLTGLIIGELYARIETRFQQPQRIALVAGWVVAGVVAWLVTTILLTRL